ncbi:hypothetical protein GF325_11975 [Candidatus Bathyarchaeota archaeon]|nr:hypothetical protein [Candidatus Bathyarchaeota archaeon]
MTGFIGKSGNHQALILEADGTIDGTNGYGTPIRRRLGDLGISSAMISLEARANELNDAIESISCPLIISGGMTQVTSSKSWMEDARNAISSLIQLNLERDASSRVPILGICFGAQLIAEAHDPGSVQYLDTPEIGSSEITLNASSHPLFRSINSQFTAYAFHYNQIWSDDVHALSIHHLEGNRFLQAFEIKDAASYGVQFHPEFTLLEMTDLFMHYSGLIEDLGFSSQEIIESLPRVDNSILIQNFLELARKM